MNCSGRAVLMFLAISVGACGSRSDQASLRTANDQETAAITKTFTDFATAWNAGDADRIGSFYADDAIILPGNHQAESGRDAIVKFNKDFFEHFKPGRLDLSIQEIKMSGDLAFNRGTYKITATPNGPGPLINDQGKFLVLLQRQTDGSWKWIRDMDNSDLQPQAPAAETKK